MGIRNVAVAISSRSTSWKGAGCTVLCSLCVKLSTVSGTSEIKTAYISVMGNQGCTTPHGREEHTPALARHCNSELLIKGYRKESMNNGPNVSSPDVFRPLGALRRRIGSSQLFGGDVGSRRERILISVQSKVT